MAAGDDSSMQVIMGTYLFSGTSSSFGEILTNMAPGGAKIIMVEGMGLGELYGLKTKTQTFCN